MNNDNKSLEKIESISTNPRPFPFDVLPDPIREFVHSIAQAKSIDPLMVLMPVLGVLSGGIGNARRLRLRSDYFAPAVLWPVLVASSGDGKSPAFHAAMKPLVDLQIEASKQFKIDLAAYKVAKAEWMKLDKQDRGDPPEPPVMTHHYLADVTAEGIGLRLSETPRGLLVAVDEFRGLVGAFNQHKGGRGNDLESWLSFYDAGAAKIDRKTGDNPSIFIPQAFVAATGTIQLPVLRTLLNPAMIGCGFAARLLLAMPTIRRRKWIDADPDRHVVKAYGELVKALRNLDHDPDDPKHVTPTASTMTLWRAWIDETEAARLSTDDEAMRAAIPKLADVAARLALIFHLVCVVDHSPGIEADTLDETSMSAGITIARWFIGETERIYDLIGEPDDDRDRRELIELIRRNGGSITTTVLADKSRKYRGNGAAAAALDDLVYAGLAKTETITTGGRPATVYRLIESIEAIAALDAKYRDQLNPSG